MSLTSLRSGFTTRTTVPIYTLVWLRIALGLLGAGDILGNGMYYHWYLDSFSGFTFRYLGFEWVHPLPEPFLSLFFIVGFLAGIAVALGWRFRFTAPFFALCFTYLFLLEKAHYLNHAYLFTWLAWLLVFTPAWREWSLDVRRDPTQWSPVAPKWSIYVFPLLMGLVYFFGGINKINYDWLIEASPLHLWLRGRSEMPVLGPLFAEKSTAYLMAWGGMLLDLLSPFLLLHRRLRWVALSLLIFFHATNHLIFNIGIFPYLSLVLTSLFFEPDWPMRFVKWLATKSVIVARWREGWRKRVGKPIAPAELWHPRPAAILLLVGLHVFLPLRNYLFASDVNWTEEGHRYSWRMMLRSKQGTGYYTAVTPDGERKVVNPRDSLDARQYRKMVTHPDMILQYAHYIRDQYAGPVEIYGHFRVQLNGRQRRPFIDPAVDLAKTEWSWLSRKPWVLDEVRE
ncbi:vitamin K-dependent gamma-carboxylase-like protein [Neolewinella xylanilytica]|uniref:Vitamin K-dependent gamma-carboxylase-like protein n=1 Tax=Neolewinella xylanilytica TaxID=1514080 RepID=A0A2S6I6F8_9BACT|nr:HTTM domain-containing protein [Neolewinella xylanilytica]PPK86725.1 vitamin K-dependent gamma-carboxylase-like protein [Neolewinella xylanilytica]